MDEGKTADRMRTDLLRGMKALWAGPAKWRVE